MPEAKLYCGTSGFAYSSWKPDFYPEKLPSSGFLSYYPSRLNAVEVNYTYRRILQAGSTKPRIRPLEKRMLLFAWPRTRTLKLRTSLRPILSTYDYEDLTTPNPS